MKPKIEIIITDDHELLRQGLRTILEMEGIYTIAEANNGKELLELLEVKKLKPDIILLDLDMPVMDGKKTLTHLRERHPDLKVIILTTFGDGSLQNDYISKGAKLYLSKKSNGQVIAEAIRNVLYYKGFSEGMKKAKSIFTEIEIQTIPLLLAGKTGKEIAAHFGVSKKAIEARRNRLYIKTGCNNGMEFNSFCVREGLAFLGNNDLEDK